MPKSSPFTVSDYLIARLREAGLKHLFAVPGDYASAFLEAVDATGTIQRVANVNELGSGYAADGYGRFAGIGAACVQYGVGTFSVLNCAAGSFVERVPVVIISASPSTKARQITRQQGVLYHHSTGNLEADKLVYENITVASEIIYDPALAPSQIDGAMTAMLTSRRPIYIEVLQNVWSLPCAKPVGKLKPVVIPSEAASLEAAVTAAYERIRQAKLPVIWAGVEIQRYGLQPLLQQLVDATGCFFTTTSLGKTVLDESQPQFIGTYAGPASPALTRAIMAATDCPIALGTIITDDYLDIMADAFGKMIEVTDEETRVGYEYFLEVTLNDFLEELLVRVKADKRFPRKFKKPSVDPDPIEVCKPEDGLTYNRFYHQLCSFLETEKLLDEVVLILGESTSLYVFGNYFGMPQDSFVAQAAWGSLGHETGCALGVELATGKRPFVVAGDGGFRMVCQELSSLATVKSSAVVFVMSNDAYAIEQAFVDIKAFTPAGSFAAFDLLPTWDYLALAKAFGAQGYVVRTVGELQTVLQEVNALEGIPALIEVRIPQKDLAPQLKRLATTP